MSQNACRMHVACIMHETWATGMSHTCLANCKRKLHCWGSPPYIFYILSHASHVLSHYLFVLKHCSACRVCGEQVHAHTVTATALRIHVELYVFLDIQDHSVLEVGGGELSITTMFSLAYLWHVGPSSLQYRILFDVGKGDNPKALLWLQAPPTPCPPIMP